MGYRTASNRTKTFRVAVALCALPLFPLSAQDGTRKTTQTAERPSSEWESDFERLYAEALVEKSLVPSPLALRIARAAGGPFWAGLDPSEAVGFVLELAIDAEKSLRFGVSAQETRALSRQRAAIERSKKNEHATLKGLAKGRKWDSERKNKVSDKTGNTAGPVGNSGQHSQTDTLPQDSQNSQTDNQGGQGPEQGGAPHGLPLDPESW